MTKVLKIFLISIILFLSAYGSANAVIFSGLDEEGVPYGVCLGGADDPSSPNYNEEDCAGVTCNEDEWKNDPKCISQAQAGTGLAKTSLGDSGITHTEKLSDLIIKYVNFVLPYLTLAAFVGFVVAGFLYVTAYGDQAHLDKAKKILIWAIVGLILVIASFTIVQFFTLGLLGKLE